MLKQIQERRSHFLKEFNGEKAPDELINTLLNAAIWAPSHKLTLPFRFVVYGPDKLPLFAQQIESSFRNRNADPNTDKIAKMQSFPQRLSHAIAIILKPSQKVPLWEEYASLGAAIQNIYLTLCESDSFGGYWTTGNEIDSPMMRNALKISPEEIHCGYFFIGGINTKRTQAQRPDIEVIWI